MKLTINCRSYHVDLQEDAVVVEGTPYKTSVLRDASEATVKVAGRPYKVKVVDQSTVLVDGRPFNVALNGRATIARQAAKAAGGPANFSQDGAVFAPMPGTVLSLRVQPGERVPAGAVVLILEAMKMQNEIKAPHDGIVKRISVACGQTVGRGDLMAVIE